MRRLLRSPVLLLALCGAFTGPAAPLSAATYLPMADADLAAGAPVIVHAAVVSQSVRLESVSGRDLPFTIVTLRRIEAIRGAVGDTFDLHLPGGRSGDVVWSLPGVPRFRDSDEVVLMLRPATRAGEWHLTELGLSRFDLVVDASGRRFAVRPEFDPMDDLLVAKRSDVADAARAASTRPPAREAESFLSALRAVGRGEPMPDVSMSEPRGDLGRPAGLREKWGNIGGREPGDGCGGDPCLFRWFWEAGAPEAVVTVTGTQTNLGNDDAAGCGTDATCDVQSGIDGWHDVPLSDVHVSGPAVTGNVTITLDAAQSFDNGATWSTPFGCSGGTIGLGGPNEGTGPRAYRGDTTYYSPSGGTVSMRKDGCTTSQYSARTFRTAVMHELGHVLGLHHPGLNGDNVVTSIHSTTRQSDWDVAVMHASVPATKPETPQTDDVQAIQYLYGTAAVGAPPAAAFSVAPAAPTAGSRVTFTDGSANSPTGWQWDFGDPDSGSANSAQDRNPTHTFARPGSYTVTLYAGSLNGTGVATKTVVVAPGAASGPCVATATTLCLNNGRFAVTTAYRASNGQNGPGNGVALTSDSGYFWFFSPANIEVVLKVLNACSLDPPRYWVFAAGLTNVEVTLTVTDTQAGGPPKVYTNPLGTPFAPIQDTDAFATCP